MEPNQDASQPGDDAQRDQPPVDDASVEARVRVSLDGYQVPPAVAEQIVADHRRAGLPLLRRIADLVHPFLIEREAKPALDLGDYLRLVHDLQALALIHANWFALASAPNPLEFMLGASSTAPSEVPTASANLGTQPGVRATSFADALVDLGVESALAEAGTPPAGWPQVIADHRLVQAHQPNHDFACYAADLVAAFDAEGEFESRRGRLDPFYLPSENRTRLAARIYLAILIGGRAIAEWDRQGQPPPSPTTVVWPDLSPSDN